MYRVYLTTLLLGLFRVLSTLPGLDSNLSHLWPQSHACSTAVISHFNPRSVHSAFGLRTRERTQVVAVTLAPRTAFMPPVAPPTVECGRWGQMGCDGLETEEVSGVVFGQSYLSYPLAGPGPRP